MGSIRWHVDSAERGGFELDGVVGRGSVQSRVDISKLSMYQAFFGVLGRQSQLRDRCNLLRSDLDVVYAQTLAFCAVGGSKGDLTVWT